MRGSNITPSRVWTTTAAHPSSTPSPVPSRNCLVLDAASVAGRTVAPPTGYGAQAVIGAVAVLIEDGHRDLIPATIGQ
jgi:hypothetical protein